MRHSILIVEDNTDNLKLVTWILEDEGYGFTCVETAEAALEIMKKEVFDLVLMDISLPGMNGKEATRHIRAKSTFETLPVIAVTAHAVKGEIEDILSSGVSALLTKPIDEEHLLQTIESFIGAEK